ncbi:hypothetical protein ACMAZD_03185 [Vibrio sp. nBUS_14]
MYSKVQTLPVAVASRLPTPNRHVHSHGHHRTPQKAVNRDKHNLN